MGSKERTKRNSRILALCIVAVFAVSALSAGLGGLANLTFSAAAASASCTSFPCASSITVTSYNGEDSSAISDLVNGKIGSYDYQLTPVEVSSLPSSYQQISTPNTLYEIIVNPENTTWSAVSPALPSVWNPFYFPQVRQAFNYVMNRQYFVDDILGGEGVPVDQVYGVAPDSLTVANATAPYQSYLTYNFQLANTTIYNTLTANGAKYVNSKYYFDNNPVTVYIADRTDDPFRSQYAGYISTQLINLGFTVVEEAMDLTTASATVFTEDPVNGTGGTPVTPWDLYFGSYGNVFGYYGDELQVCFDGADCSEVPYSDNYTGPLAGCECANFAWPTLNATPPDIVALSDKVDYLNYEILAGTYTTAAARTAVLSAYAADEIEMGVNDWVATGLNVYGVNPSLVTGLDPVVTTTPVLNLQSALTMTNPSGGTVPLGVRYLTQYNINPLRIQGDAYSADLLSTVLPFVDISDPGTGYLLPFGYTLTVNAASPSGSISIPRSAVNYNGTTGAWANVTSGATAKLEFTVNFANSVNHLGFADNETWSLADLLYPYVATVNASTPTSKVYDSEVQAEDGPGLANIVGLKLVNSTTIQVYSNYIFEDPNYAAIITMQDIVPSAIYSMPWTTYVAMSDVVGSGAYAWTAAGAVSHHNTQLTLVASGQNGAQADVTALKNDLTARASQDFLPGPINQLQTLTGVTMVTPGTQAAMYTDAANFIGKYDNAIIGNGPYFISNFQATTTPNFAILSVNPNYGLGGPGSPYLPAAMFTTAAEISVSTTVPATVTPGTTIPITTLSTPLGSRVGTPTSGVNLTIQLISGTNIVNQAKLVSGAGGSASYTIPTVSAGAYTITIYADSANSTIIRPQTYSTTILGPVTSTSTTVPTSVSSTTTSGTSTTSTTTAAPSVSNADLEIIAGIVVVIIIIAAVVLFVRRRPAPATAPA